MLGARHLPKSGRGITSPFVEIEIIGLSCDNDSFRTKTKRKRIYFDEKKHDVLNLLFKIVRVLQEYFALNMTLIQMYFIKQSFLISETWISFILIFTPFSGQRFMPNLV